LSRLQQSLVYIELQNSPVETPYRGDAVTEQKLVIKILRLKVVLA
jgi:hypothetical protein